MRYDIASGVKRAKTKTTAIVSVLVLGASGFGATLAVPLVTSAAVPCSAPISTSRGSLTAEVVATTGDNITGDVDGTGCDIGVYIASGVSNVNISATVHDANQYGVLNDGTNVTVDTSTITNTGNHNGAAFEPNGVQTGIGIFYSVNATGSITNNIVNNYQKGGIVVNREGASADITGNTVSGFGPIDFIAQNGIQVSRGAIATDFSDNVVSGNIYTQNGSAAPEGVGSSVGIVSTGVLFFQAGGSPKTGTIASSNHVFQNQANVTIIK